LTAPGSALTGTADGSGTLFIALARLTAEPGPRPLTDLVSVQVEETGEGPAAYDIRVRWTDGPERRVRLGSEGEAADLQRADGR